MRQVTDRSYSIDAEWRRIAALKKVMDEWDELDEWGWNDMGTDIVGAPPPPSEEDLRRLGDALMEGLAARGKL